MKRLAIIPPSDSPIPAIDGGAIETLTTYFLEENEKNPTFLIDVYCLENVKLNDVNYKFTNILQVPKPFALKLNKLFFSLLNKIYSFFKIDKAFFYFDKQVAKYINYHMNYDYILVENNMNVFEYICRYRNGSEKLFFHLHNDILNSPYKSERLCRLVYDKSEKIFCASDYLYERFNSFVGINELKKIKLLTNCIDFNLFKFSDEVKVNYLKKSFGIGTNDFVILYSGRITPEKGVLELVQAISMIEKKVNLKCVIIGDSWFGTKTESNYLSRIKDITKGDNRYIFVGRVAYDEINLYYQIADLTVIPSKWEEPFGMVALESLAMGCPILIAEKGGLKSIPNTKCGFIIDESKGLTKGIYDSLKYIINIYPTISYSLKNEAINRAHSNYYGTGKYFELFVKEVD